MHYNVYVRAERGSAWIWIGRFAAGQLSAARAYAKRQRALWGRVRTICVDKVSRH